MLKRLTLLSVFFGFTSCGVCEEKPAKPSRGPIDAIMDTRQTYLELIKGVDDDHGFVESDRCDSLLFSGLAAYGGHDVAITAARDNETGRWHRTPYHDCYRNERRDIDASRRSKSTISRDMLVGAMWALYGAGDLGSLERLIDYGRRNNWVMGKGSLDRTYLTPAFQDTLYRMTGRTYKGPPYLWIDPRSEHQRNVVALHILLRGELEGSISAEMLDLVREFKKDSPMNALFSYVWHRFSDGHQAETIELLEMIFPPDRLPTSSDWCAEYLWMRDDDGSDWMPCDEGRTHSGADFLFVSKLLISTR